MALATSWAILCGFSGYFSFGHGAFFGAGMYASANLSKHLQVLLAQGFLSRRKEGLFAYYSLADASVFELCDLMCARLETEAAARRQVLGRR